MCIPRILFPRLNFPKPRPPKISKNLKLRSLKSEIPHNFAYGLLSVQLFYVFVDGFLLFVNLFLYFHMESVVFVRHIFFDLYIDFIFFSKKHFM